MTKKKKKIKQEEVKFPKKKESFIKKYIKMFFKKYINTKWGKIILATVILFFILGGFVKKYFF